MPAFAGMTIKPYSSSSSLSRSTDTTCSSSAVLSTITPCVERPAMRMPETGVRISLPCVGHQHDLVGLLDRERGDQLADLRLEHELAALLLPDVHGDDAFAAAAGDAVLVGRGALAVAALRQRQHELLGRRHFDIALFAELDRRHRLLAVGHRLLLDAAAPHRVGALEIGGALVRAWRRYGARIDSEITLSSLSSAMPRTPIEVRPVNTRTSGTGKRMHWPPAVVSSTSSFSVQIGDVDDRLARRRASWR